jgi:hypothetical protein
MSSGTGNGVAATESQTLELPPYTLDVQAMDLGPGVQAVGLELVETENREPVTGGVAAEMWAAILPALVADEPYAVDFFSHLERVREFCTIQGIAFREAAQRCLVIEHPGPEKLRQLFERFEKETFGVRVGAAAASDDAVLEGELSLRGLDAYQQAYARYTFCAVCEPEDGWATLLSETLWASEAIRRVRPALQAFDVYISRPQ